MDPMKAKHLEKALMQFAEEGAAKVFKPMIGSGFIVGVVGALQFEVLASRIEQEYSLPVRFEPSQFTSARWVSGDKLAVEKFVNVNKGHIATDSDGDMVYLTRLQWDIDRITRDYPRGQADRDQGNDGLKPRTGGPIRPARAPRSGQVASYPACCMLRTFRISPLGSPLCRLLSVAIWSSSVAWVFDRSFRLACGTYS